MSNNSYTFRLFNTQHTFVNGVTSCLKMFSDDTKVYKMNKTEKEADWNSLYSDWLAVGNDLKITLEEHEQQSSRKQKSHSK